ncbi:MAG TPA: zeta toxin family protein [Opitutaceae bacterium]|nr:zeta toxin family protein [Opitutaceae bacterium]
MPNLFIIAGPNGAGKTTYARDFLVDEMRCHEFVNADLIAAGVSPFAPAQAGIEAGRIMIRRLRQLLVEQKDFAFETTLSGYTYIHMLEDARAAGYRIRLDFLWISSLDIARERICQRVRKGGHDIPDDVQRRRFRKGIRMLIEHYRPLLDHWRLFDNTGDCPRIIADERDGVFTVIDAARIASLAQIARVRLVPEVPPRAVEEPVAALFSEETRAAMRAMRRAYARVVLENKAYGLPLIQWREGRGAVRVPAESLEPFARRILETNGEPLPEEEERALLHGVP